MSAQIHSKGKIIFGATVSIALLIFTGCDNKKEQAPKDHKIGKRQSVRADQTLRLVYPQWSSEIASAHLFQAVLQNRMGYRVQLKPASAEQMWQQVASGKADVLTGAWLPTTHRDYYKKYAESLEDLGPTLTGARIGLVVPTITPSRQTGESGRTARELVTIRSIPELENSVSRFNGRIVGIESGAGVVARSRDAIEAYDLEGLYQLVDTNETRMINRVADAINRGEWIVFTGWKPHRIFERYNLRFLDDPKNVFGREESIHTMVRSGLKEDMPTAYKVLSRISYSPEDLERLMRWIHSHEAQGAAAQAERWIRIHSDKVDKWVKNVE